MAVIRTVDADGVRFQRKMTDAKAKKMGPRERDFRDWDLAWGGKADGLPGFAVYVLEVGEFFDPKTSSHGRHNMHGPAVIVVNSHGGSLNTNESHANDPTVWQWITRCIAEGHLTADNVRGPGNERDIEFAE